MKKTFLIILFFCSLQGFGQIITQMPEIDDQTSGETDITKVELREDYTVIHFKYQSSSRKNYNFQFLGCKKK